MKQILFILCITVTFKVHAQFRYADYKPLFQLIGRWELKTSKGVLVEEWHKVNDSLLQNKSYRLEGVDSIHEETVQLQFSNGTIQYIPTLEQNKGKLIIFELVSADGGRFVFENKLHDFPQQILYQPGKETLLVTISGPGKNGLKEKGFNFIRK